MGLALTARVGVVLLLLFRRVREQENMMALFKTTVCSQGSKRRFLDVLP